MKKEKVGNLGDLRAVRIGDRYYFSGIISYSYAGKGIESECERAAAQTRSIFHRTQGSFLQSGFSLNDIYKVTIMLNGSMDNYPGVIKAYNEFFKEIEIKPALTVFAVVGLPEGALVQIELEVVK